MNVRFPKNCQRIRDDADDTQLVAGIHECRGLRIVAAERRKPRVPKLLGVPVLLRVRQRVAHVGVILVPVEPQGEELVAVDEHTVGRKLHPSYADPRAAVVYDLPADEKGRAQGVEVRMMRVPQPRPAHRERLPERLSGARFQHGVRYGRDDARARSIHELLPQRERPGGGMLVDDIGLHLDPGLLCRDGRIAHEDAAPRNRVGQDLVGNVEPVQHLEPDIPVQPPEVGEIQPGLRTAGRQLGIVRVVQPYQQRVVRAELQVVGQVQGERQVSTVVRGELLPVQPDVCDLHRAFETEPGGAVPVGPVDRKGLAVPAHALVVPAATRVQRLEPHGVRQVDRFPSRSARRLTGVGCGGQWERRLAGVESPCLDGTGRIPVLPGQITEP